MKALRNIVAALTLSVLLPVCGASGQGLPSLEKAKEINVGKLPDGITYYLISNKTAPGLADFAIVQNHRPDRVGPRQDLVSLPHFQGRKPYEFLSDAGVRYRERGFIQHFRDATVFQFADVPVSEASVADSTLLMMFDIVRSSAYSQALVVSGDIDLAAIKERIRILSMTVSQREEADARQDYSWKPQEDAAVTTGTAPVGTIIIHYRSPRTDRELMNTIQPVMSKLLASELGIILEHRLRAAFQAAGVPLADFRYRYTGSDETSGDEMFSIAIYTSPARLEDALRLSGGVLSDLDRDGSTTEEVSFARSIIAETAQRDSKGTKLTNAQYIDKCVAAYLYGANLAPASAVSAVYTGRKLDVERERELLGRYVSSTLSPSRNLHLHVRSTAKMDEARALQIFTDGWQKGAAVPSDIPSEEDTLNLVTTRKKVKLKTTTADAYSGGKILTFSNGISVIFKKAATQGAFHYGLMMKGGWTEIPGINGAEAAFAGDVLALERTAGMSGTRFRELLQMHGISMDTEVTLSDVRYTGSAPRKSLPLLLKAMLSLTSASEADTAAFRRYCSEKSVRLERDKFSAAGTRAALDSIMCPGYAYASGSLPGLPGEDFPARVDSYLRRKGETMRNAIIVLVGDLDEDATLKTLIQYIGGFSTSQQRVIRPRLEYPLRDCWSTSYALGGWRDKGVTVSLSAFWPFNSEGNTGLDLACTVLEAELARSLDSKGYHFSVTRGAELLPAEKLTVFVNCNPCPVSGVPADVVPASPVEVLQAVREVINRLAVEGVPDGVLARSKTLLTGSMEARSGDYRRLRDNILYRNALGRDLTGGYKERIKALRSSDIQAMFRELSKSWCEYVVQ